MLSTLPAPALAPSRNRAPWGSLAAIGTRAHAPLALDHFGGTPRLSVLPR